MLKIFLFLYFLGLSEGITRFTYTDSTCSEIQSIENYSLDKCRILSLGGQLYSIKITKCNTTNWNTNVYLNNINCSNVPDVIQEGPSNICYLGYVNLYEKINCYDIITTHSNSNNLCFSFIVFFPLLLTFFI